MCKGFQPERKVYYELEHFRFSDKLVIRCQDRFSSFEIDFAIADPITVSLISYAFSFELYHTFR